MARSRIVWLGAIAAFAASILVLSRGPAAIGWLSQRPALKRGATSSRFLLESPADATLGMAENSDALRPIHYEEACEEIYGFLPCSTSVGGNTFLMIAYGYLVLIAAKLISEGSEMLLQVLDPGIIGGLLLPILGAMPDTLLIAVSGISGTKAEAQEQVMVGMGILAGSTIMILTIAWGGSLLCGRCDLVERPGQGLVAKDRTLTRPRDIVTTGVTTDEQTRIGAWIMMASCVPYIIMQIPIMDGTTELAYQSHVAALIGLILSFVGLVAYCIYQVSSPWLQQKRIEQARMHYIRTLAIRDLYNLAKSKTFGVLINPDGSPNEATLANVFDSFDSDHSGSLSHTELKALILGLGIRQGAVPPQEEISAWLKEFDLDDNGEIAKDEFIRGMAGWMRKVATSGTPGVAAVGAPVLRAPSHDQFWERHALVAQGELESLQDGVDDDEEEEEHVPKTPAEIIKEAVLLILGGTILVAVFADPVVDSIGAFSKASNIPPFFVAFVVTPLASNASELVSSLVFAMRKRKRTISLTYSQVYGAITMNNTMCLGVFLALVFFRGLSWEFSAEVTVILLITAVVGFIGGSKRTFPTWMAIVMLLLYPLSLLIVIFLDFVLGWK